jgi:hypothetical protein
MSAKVKNQCIGERHYGVFQIGAPAGWQRCRNDAVYLLDIVGAGGEKGYACQNCYDEILKSGQTPTILKHFPAGRLARRVSK